MRLFFGGAEIDGWRKLLAEEDISDVYFSYMGLRRRTRFSKPWLVSERFPAGQNVMLDSGAYTVNKNTEDYTLQQLMEIAEHYIEFVKLNIDSLYAVTEFDVMAMGYDWIEKQRQEFFNYLGDKFIPVWHVEYGLDTLDAMAARYQRIAILQTEVDGRDLAPQLNAMVRRYGTKLHGLAMTKPDIMREIAWDSVGSTSWINPVKYGETFVWTSKELKWYPADYKTEARRRHRTLFTAEGFDADKIADPADKKEVLRLSLWSWTKFVEDINRREGVTTAPETRDSDSAEEDGQAVTTTHGRSRNEELSPSPRPRARDKVLFPGLEGTYREDESPTLSNVGTSMRMCDTCFLKDRGCPEYQPGAECAYGLPPVDLTIEEIEDILIQMQFGRVQFLRLVEDIEGGMADPALSGEVDRLGRLIKQKREGTMFTATEVRRIRMPATEEGAGIVASLLGPQAADKLHAVEAREAEYSVADDVAATTHEKEDQ